MRRIAARRKTPYRLTAFVRTLALEPRDPEGAGASVELAELGGEAGAAPLVVQLARRSVRFSQAYATSPWTTPSFGSILTSRYPAQHRGGTRKPTTRSNSTPSTAARSTSPSASAPPATPP